MESASAAVVRGFFRPPGTPPAQLLLIVMDGTTNPPTLFELIGGEGGVAKLIDEFYLRVLDDPDLQPLFKGASMNHLRHMQRDFFTTALGGPASYSGRSLSHAHHGRGITKHHFGKFVQHLLGTLRARGLDERHIDAVIDRLNVHANEITGTSY